MSAAIHLARRGVAVTLYERNARLGGKMNEHRADGYRFDTGPSLLTMPEVAEAVVVATPEPRLGEHAAAVLRIRDGHAMPTLEEVRAHFERSGVARQKWPEELHRVDDYPRTASGKVQKYLVRKSIREGRLS